MKRYKAINFEYDDAYGTGTALDIVEHDEGEWVKYDDIKHLLPNTPSNSDYAKCEHERGSMVTENGQEWFVCKHCNKKYERYF